MLSSLILYATLFQGESKPLKGDATPGQLTIVGNRDLGVCPLERTSVTANISGFGARVTVVQTFKNPTNAPIEAVYTFPLSHTGAVDRMRMQVGDRVIEGEIKRREEARQIYEAAKNAGQVASLLDQERPNIFTQSVANIMPNATVRVEISYVELLKFDDGKFEFSYPMVVGPRFLGNAPDAGKINPPVAPKGTRTGTNIDLTVNLDAGAPLEQVGSVLHAVNIKRIGKEGAQIQLARKDEIANRDFMLRFQPTSDTVRSALLTHMDPQRGGHFALVLLPPKAPTHRQIRPKEVIFVMDQSGSQNGFPIEKSKELTLKLIRRLRPEDTFNVIGFNNTVRTLWSSPRPNTRANIEAAESFVRGMQANGGTQLRAGVEAALQGQADAGRLRIVLFNTDGYVGDEAHVLAAIQEHRQSARMFTFGIGNSVNRYLLDAMSVEGRGDVEYVTLASDADEAANRMIDRLEKPVLTDVKLSFEGVEVLETFPAHLPDVYSERPVVVYGRYKNPGSGRVHIQGKLGSQDWHQAVELDLPSTANAPAVMSLWARNKVDDLTRSDFVNIYVGDRKTESKEELIAVALKYGIMTQHTSFVAVEKRVVNIGGRQRTIVVPVEQADGVEFDGYPDGLFRGGNPVRRMALGGSNSLPAGAGGVGGGKAVGTTGTTGSTGTTGTTGTGGGGFVGANSNSSGSIVELEKSMTPEQRRKSRYERIVTQELQEAKGKVEVEVWLTKVTPEIVAALKKLGLTVALEDKTLKVVIGECDAKVLIEIAQVAEVWKVRKLL